jgi:hypothetical protein
MRENNFGWGIFESVLCFGVLIGLFFGCLRLPALWVIIGMFWG